ncbi:DUF3152 domain-containing protein [Kribbella monticola]|uniref:DUF3152 domain-containing protein n=1 Tax=Kribbella monticola TaxID=2185285 RepID=UPI001E6353C7|nr:DUF3152 domain-containing protein [Kribbella monticola]
MRMTRIATLGIVVAVAGVALYEVPASPFDHKGVPIRPAAHSSVDPDDSTGKNSPDGTDATGDPVAPDPSAKPADQKPGDQTSASTPGDDSRITYPERGSRSYAVLPGDPATIGASGRLMKFQIAVEGGIQGVDRPAFAEFVRATYGAPQGWASAGQWRFRQVGPGQPADFQLLLVTPETRDILCGGGPDRYTSCRIGDRVVLNVARWAHAVPNYGASLTAYRHYMVNHETGHRLGNHHELCRGPGQPAPVMEQQTLGLHGCVANSWPYLDGTRYKGRAGQYNDPVPAS